MPIPAIDTLKKDGWEPEDTVVSSWDIVDERHSWPVKSRVAITTVRKVVVDELPPPPENNG